MIVFSVVVSCNHSRPAKKSIISSVRFAKNNKDSVKPKQPIFFTMKDGTGLLKSSEGTRNFCLDTITKCASESQKKDSENVKNGLAWLDIANSPTGVLQIRKLKIYSPKKEKDTTKKTTKRVDMSAIKTEMGVRVYTNDYLSVSLNRRVIHPNQNDIYIPVFPSIYEPLEYFKRHYQ